MHTERRSFLDVDFDLFTRDELLKRLSTISSATPFGYLVTPNVDHLVRLHRSARDSRYLAAAYERADYCVCDSKVLALLARMRGQPLTVIPGSDLTLWLLESVVRRGDRIAIIGGDEDMVDILEAKYPHIGFVQHRPPMGLLGNAPARRAAAEFIAGQQARFTFICVGSPQQELIALETAEISGSGGLALCVGAALDFITGSQQRAPALMRRFGLEWAHRLLTNPARLWRRYLVDGPKIFLLSYRWRRSL